MAEKKEKMMRDQVFSIREGEWQACLGGEVLPITWNSKGAALAGLKVEAARKKIHLLARDCWCQPIVDGTAPDEVPLEELIEHQRSIYDGDVSTFGTESHWTVLSGSILASLLELQDRRAALQSAPGSASTPQPGMVTVPREPTEAMLDAAIAWRIALKVADSYSMRGQFADCYRAMLDAALRSGGRETTEEKS